MSRELLKRVLDALDEYFVTTDEGKSLLKEIEDYLSNPLPEPVATVSGGTVVWIQPQASKLRDRQALYAEPPARSPMPDVEISKAFCDESCVSIGDTIEDAFEAGVRYGEQYHGIKG